jgi:hypothetical protein
MDRYFESCEEYYGYLEDEARCQAEIEAAEADTEDPEDRRRG